MDDLPVEAGKPEFFDSVHFQSVQENLIGEGELIRVFTLVVAAEYFVGQVDVCPPEIETLFVWSEDEVRVAAVVDQPLDPAVLDLDGKDDDSSLIGGVEVDFFAGEIPDDFSDVQVEAAGGVTDGTVPSVVNHQVVLVCLEARSSHGAVGDILSVGGIDGLVVVADVARDASDGSSPGRDDEDIVIGRESHVVDVAYEGDLFPVG